MKQSVQLFSSKRRYFWCKLVPERLGFFFAWSTIFLLFSFLIMEEDLEPSFVCLPSFFLIYIISDIIKRYALESNMHCCIFPLKKNLYLTEGNKIVYEGNEMNMSKIDTINIHKEQASFVTNVRSSLNTVKYFVRLVRIRKLDPSLQYKLKKGHVNAVKPQKDLFFIAYYGITDSFIIFFLNLFTLGFVKDLPEKLFIKRVLSPFEKATATINREICFTEKICTNLNAVCE